MIFGRKAPSDIEDLTPQRARYLPTGAEVRTEARDRLGYRLDGRAWSPFIESGTAFTAVYIDLHPTWNDGTPMTEDELRQALHVVTEVLKHWGSEVEIMWPPDQEGSTA